MEVATKPEQVARKQKKQGYNERLFESGGLRGYYHNARYRWIANQLAGFPSDIDLFELGCFDAKLVDHVPNGFVRYVGADANWEKGLDQGRKRLADRGDVELIEMREPVEMDRFADKSFDVSVSMETLEHIPDAIMVDYLRQLARVTRRKLFVTVPNEMGPVFVAKYVGKRLFIGPDQPYRLSEVLAAAFYQSDRIERDQHKGFDYGRLVKQMSPFFQVESVGPVPSLPVPTALGLSIGIVARPR